MPGPRPAYGLIVLSVGVTLVDHDRDRLTPAGSGQRPKACALPRGPAVGRDFAQSSGTTGPRLRVASAPPPGKDSDYDNPNDFPF